MRIRFAALLIIILGASASAQMTSVYTSTRAEACGTIISSTEGSGSFVAECRGPAGFKVQVVEGDLRQSLNLITPSKRRIELNFWGHYSSFSSIGDKLEWRIKDRTPAALIARYVVSNPEDPQRSTSYLIVSKIGQNAACVTDIVKPGPRQNEEARRLADAAGSKPCKPLDQ